MHPEHLSSRPPIPPRSFKTCREPILKTCLHGIEQNLTWSCGAPGLNLKSQTKLNFSSLMRILFKAFEFLCYGIRIHLTSFI